MISSLLFESLEQAFNRTNLLDLEAILKINFAKHFLFVNSSKKDKYSKRNLLLKKLLPIINSGLHVKSVFYFYINVGMRQDYFISNFLLTLAKIQLNSAISDSFSVELIKIQFRMEQYIERLSQFKQTNSHICEHIFDCKWISTTLY